MSSKQDNDKPAPEGWTKQWSRSQKRNFYFHEKTKTSIWHYPTEDEAKDPIKAKQLADLKTKQEQEQNNSKKSSSGSSSKPSPSSSVKPNESKKRYNAPTSILGPIVDTSKGLSVNHQNNSSSKSPYKKQKTSSSSSEDPLSSLDTTNVAIIVPYRDLHPEQQRAQHLKTFIVHMNTFLTKLTKSPPLISDYHVYIIEQSNDERKFNRGKLLNIGFDYAKKTNPKHDVFIFHDVDLLPGDDLGSWYARFPKAPIHIARVWDRYSNNPKYFGGIVSFSATDMRRINGYPNNFWGWGGEDDEMQKRCEKLRIKWDYPLRGTIQDLEQMNISEKINFLRQHKEWKCQEKWEVLKEHDRTWKNNGLSDLTYKVLDKSYLDEKKKSTKLHVDVLLNGNHWSNDKCHVNYQASWSKK